MITPMEIHNREFKKVFRGYSENEVDEFLDKVVVDYERILRENQKLRDQLSLNTQEVENYKKLEKNLQDTLGVAQKTAEDVLQSAQKSADEILESAKKSAKELRDNAARDTQSIYDNTMRETQNIREQAELKSKRLLDDAAHKLRNVVAEYEKIVREKNSFLLKIRTALESELAVTSQLLTSVPRLDELANLKSSLAKIETEHKFVTKTAEVPAENISQPDAVIEKVSQVISTPKVVEVEKVAEIKKVPEPQKTAEKISSANLEDTKSVVKVEKISEKKVPEVTADDLDKTMTYTPIKKG